MSAEFTNWHLLIEGALFVIVYLMLLDTMHGGDL